MKYSSAELETALVKIRGTTSDRMSQLGLCFVLLCGDQYASMSRTKLRDTLSHLVQSTRSDMSLMLGVYFRTNQLSEIEKIVRNVLQMPVRMCELKTK
ncbi:hypothetical protein HK104_006769 [Borealophlyctis nickersoniae]|nr:hypothetical protein HK104_006769 [Borealophlyctis nickersoniae]